MLTPHLQVPNRPAYLTDLGGSGFTMANTVLLSEIYVDPDRSPQPPKKLQLALPQQLHGASGGLGIVAQCVAGSNVNGMAALRAYGTVDWSSWTNVKGTPQ